MREATLNTKKATPLPISQYSPPLNRQSSRRRLLRSAKRPFRFRQLSASQHMFSLSTLHHRMQIPRLGTMTHRPEQHTRSRKRRRQNAQLSRFVAPHVGATPSQPGSREGSWTFSRQPECTPRTGLPITYLTDRLFVQYRSFAVPSSCSMECRGPVHQYFNKQSMEPTAQPDGPTQLPP